MVVLVEKLRSGGPDNRRAAQTLPEIPGGLYSTWKAVPAGAWRWPHFSAHELACRCPTDFRYCEGEYFHDADFLDRIEKMRDLVGKPLRINSPRRCPQRNAHVKGAAYSQHKVGIACDIALAGHDPVALARAAVKAGFKGIGFGRTFLHVDARTRPPSWRGAWPVPMAFHYAGAQAAWVKLFGFDPVAQFLKKGNLDD